MPSQPLRTSTARHTLAALVVACAFSSGLAHATDAVQGIEQALNTALQDKRGITLYVNGQAISGAVTRIEPGRWVELRNQQFGRIVVRLDRIDGVAAP
jgi:predicted lipoprotein with Yx(FWY)xxD motif